jgi:hypothetical protein
MDIYVPCSLGENIKLDMDILFGSEDSIIDHYLQRGQSSILSFQPRVSSPI